METVVRPIPSHSNSFGNDAEKDTAGCRAFHRKSIVIGDCILASLETTLDGNNQYPINQLGESYGLAILADIVGEEPDLIAAVGIDGNEGYVRAEGLSADYDVQPDEVVLIPLYDVNGVEIGSFALNSMK